VLGIENLESVDIFTGGVLEIDPDDVVSYPVKILWTPADGGTCVLLKFDSYEKLSHYLKMRSYLILKAEMHTDKIGKIKIWD